MHTGEKYTHTKNVLKSSALGCKVEEWAQSKVGFVELQKEGLLNEQKLRLTHMQEKHETELALMESEAQDKRKWAFEEHKEKREILKLEKEVLKKN